MQKEPLIVVRGAGDIATGTICRLHSCGFRVLALEVAAPTAIRRSVSLCEAVYDGKKRVEGITAVCVDTTNECEAVWKKNQVAMFVDPQAMCLEKFSPLGVVDSILAKKNCGMNMEMARVTIGLGPGFFAGKDVHAVIETVRGHDLGRILYAGSALPNSGIPGEIAGFSWERVIFATTYGKLKIVSDIGTLVEAGDVVARIGKIPVLAPIRGLVRGIIRDGFQVKKGMKLADIDPRVQQHSNCHTISEKARCISGGVLEALLHLCNVSHGLNWYSPRKKVAIQHPPT